ncbi:MAG: hypothetical protein SFT81_06235 [Candidatus Caenarcaniphilales bacterium]|nr:hypothetical protein [Candidatus Caenarcaniphilales bacterium]
MIAQKLHLTHLYPRHMSLYGDRGNVLVLRSLAERNQIELEIHDCPPGGSIHPESDLILLGGGQDFDQKRIMQDLLSRKQQIADLVSQGAIYLGICGGYQLLGRYYETSDGQVIEGLGLVDLYTKKAKKSTHRMIGNLRAIGSRVGTIQGFENHGGRTFLGAGVEPLAIVVQGAGNNGEDKTEGVWQPQGEGLYLGTYLHSFLPRNVQVATQLLKRMLGTHRPLAYEGDTLDRLNQQIGGSLKY